MKMQIFIFKAWILAVIASSVLMSFGCGGGSSEQASASAGTAPPATQPGVFAGVAGLSYSSGSTAGTVDPEGRFQYEAGKDVTFSVGDVVLGTGEGEPVMTLFHIAPVEGDYASTVLNMAKFLQTIDSDANADNGVTITPDMRAGATAAAAAPAATAITLAGAGATAIAPVMLAAATEVSGINFNQPIETFANDPTVLAAVAAITARTAAGPRSLVNTLDAQNHLTTTMLKIKAARPATATIKTGVFVDRILVEGLEYVSGDISGITDASGTFKYEDGNVVTFKVGNLILGTAEAYPIMTPLNLVGIPATTNYPRFANILNFLQTIDDDGNPDNGTQITALQRTIAKDLLLDFGVLWDPFMSVPPKPVLDAIQALTVNSSAGERELSPPVYVTEYFYDFTMAGLQMGTYSFTATENDGAAAFALTGTVVNTLGWLNLFDAGGVEIGAGALLRAVHISFQIDGNPGMGFTGKVNPFTNTISGTWRRGATTVGTFTGSKQ